MNIVLGDIIYWIMSGVQYSLVKNVRGTVFTSEKCPEGQFLGGTIFTITPSASWMSVLPMVRMVYAMILLAVWLCAQCQLVAHLGLVEGNQTAHNYMHIHIRQANREAVMEESYKDVGQWWIHTLSGHMVAQPCGFFKANGIQQLTLCW